MSANRQLKRHHACHECRTKKLKCSGDRPVCDGCKRKQDHHSASGSRRPVPECTYDFAPGEEVWVHWSVSNARPTTGRPLSKRTPSPSNENKSRRSRTPTKPSMIQVESPVTIQRPMKPQGPPLSPVDLPESPPHPDLFPTQYNQYGSFLPSGLPYPYNNNMSLDSFPHNTPLAIAPTINEPFFTVGSHHQYYQAPTSMSSPELTGGDYGYPTTAYPGALPNVTLLSNGILRWM